MSQQQLRETLESIISGIGLSDASVWLLRRIACERASAKSPAADVTIQPTLRLVARRSASVCATSDVLGARSSCPSIGVPVVLRRLLAAAARC